MEGEIKRYGNWIPASGLIRVGDKEMLVKELVGSKRDAVASVMGKGIDLVEMLRPFKDTAEKRKNLMKDLLQKAVKAGKQPSVEELDKQLEKVSEEDMTLMTLLSGMQGKLMALLQGELTLLGCIILDVPENRKMMTMEDGVAPYQDYGFEHSPKMFDWIKNNLSAHQETALLEAFLAVNDFVGLAKKYMALVTPQVLAGAKKEIPATATA